MQASTTLRSHCATLQIHDMIELMHQMQLVHGHDYRNLYK